MLRAFKKLFSPKQKTLDPTVDFLKPDGLSVEQDEASKENSEEKAILASLREAWEEEANHDDISSDGREEWPESGTPTETTATQASDSLPSSPEQQQIAEESAKQQILFQQGKASLRSTLNSEVINLKAKVENLLGEKNPQPNNIQACVREIKQLLPTLEDSFERGNLENLQERLDKFMLEVEQSPVSGIDEPVIKKSAYFSAKYSNIFITNDHDQEISLEILMSRASHLLKKIYKNDMDNARTQIEAILPNLKLMHRKLEKQTTEHQATMRYLTGLIKTFEATLEKLPVQALHVEHTQQNAAVSEELIIIEEPAVAEEQVIIEELVITEEPTAPLPDNTSKSRVKFEEIITQEDPRINKDYQKEEQEIKQLITELGKTKHYVNFALRDNEPLEQLLANYTHIYDEVRERLAKYDATNLNEAQINSKHRFLERLKSIDLDIRTSIKQAKIAAAKKAVVPESPVQPRLVTPPPFVEKKRVAKIEESTKVLPKKIKQHRPPTTTVTTNKILLARDKKSYSSTFFPEANDTKVTKKEATVENKTVFSSFETVLDDDMKITKNKEQQAIVQKGDHRLGHFAKDRFIANDEFIEDAIPYMIKAAAEKTGPSYYHGPMANLKLIYQEFQEFAKTNKEAANNLRNRIFFQPAEKNYQLLTFMQFEALLNASIKPKRK